MGESRGTPEHPRLSYSGGAKANSARRRKDRLKIVGGDLWSELLGLGTLPPFNLDAR